MTSLRQKFAEKNPHFKDEEKINQTGAEYLAEVAGSLKEDLVNLVYALENPQDKHDVLSYMLSGQGKVVWFRINDYAFDAGYFTPSDVVQRKTNYFIARVMNLDSYRKIHEICADKDVDMKVSLIMTGKERDQKSYPTVVISLEQKYSQSPKETIPLPAKKPRRRWSLFS